MSPKSTLPDEIANIRRFMRLRVAEGRIDDAVTLLEKAIQLIRHNPSPQIPIATDIRQVGGALSTQDIEYVSDQATRIESRREHFEYGGEEPPSRSRLIDTSKIVDFSRDPEARVKLSEPTKTQTNQHEDTLTPSRIDPNESFLSDDDTHGLKNVDLEGSAEEPTVNTSEAIINGLLGAKDGLVGSALSERHDHDAFDGYLYDFDETANRDELSVDIETDGCVDRRTRAFQVAIEVGVQFGWEDAELEILADVFEKHGWSNAKAAIQRQLHRGLSPEELRLAIIVRETWLDYPEFSINLDGYTYEVMSWPMAIQIVRSFRSFPEPEEIEKFLIDAFLEWSSRRSLTNNYRSYFEYLLNRLRFPDAILLASPSAMLETLYDFHEDEYFSGVYTGLNTQEYQELVEYQLIPDIWVDPFAIAQKQKSETNELNEEIDMEAEHDE